MNFDFRKMVWAIVVGNLMTGLITVLLWVLFYQTFFAESKTERLIREVEVNLQ
jgi:hypothetical protein